MNHSEFGVGTFCINPGFTVNARLLKTISFSEERYNGPRSGSSYTIFMSEGIYDKKYVPFQVEGIVKDSYCS